MNNEEILNYKMTDEDKLLASLAKTIITMYSSSCQPNLISLVSYPHVYEIWHTNLGYCLIENNKKLEVKLVNEHIGHFVEQVFSLIGRIKVTWDQIWNSDAVTRALSEALNIQVDLTNYEYTTSPDNKRKILSKPTIWAMWREFGNIHDEMKERGFKYYDKNIWIIEL